MRQFYYISVRSLKAGKDIDNSRNPKTLPYQTKFTKKELKYHVRMYTHKKTPLTTEKLN